MAFLTINLAASWPSIGHAVATKVYSTTVDLVMVASYFVGQLEVDVFCFGWHIFHIAAFCSLHYVWIPFLITAIEYTTWWLLWIRLLLYPVIMLLAPVTWWFTLMADLPFKEIFFGNGRASIRWERRKVPKKETKSLTARCDDDGGGERPDKSKDEESSESNLHRKIDFQFRWRYLRYYACILYIWARANF